VSELLVLRDVCKGYRPGVRERVLEDVSLHVAPGEIVAVIGQRWEGKTTLLRLAAGMELADQGEVRFEGQDFASYSRRRPASLPGRARHSRARLLGREIVWLDRQESSLGLKIVDHVGLPIVMGRRRGRPRAQVRRLACDALERVGVAHVAEKHARDLSSWERVLVGLASAVLARPRLLVVDDLLDALGATRTQEAGDLLRSLVQEFGFGVLLSVSDFEAALLANRVLTFQQRKLKLMSNHTPTQADILPFARDGTKSDGSRSNRAC
jgi:ABC-type nitrate/sulfonate/bicarbonate transport system ATPase subunit